MRHWTVLRLVVRSGIDALQFLQSSTRPLPQRDCADFWRCESRQHCEGTCPGTRGRTIQGEFPRQRRQPPAHRFSVVAMRRSASASTRYGGTAVPLSGARENSAAQPLFRDGDAPPVRKFKDAGQANLSPCHVDRREWARTRRDVDRPGLRCCQPDIPPGARPSGRLSSAAVTRCLLVRSRQILAFVAALPGFQVMPAATRATPIAASTFFAHAGRMPSVLARISVNAVFLAPPPAE